MSKILNENDLVYAVAKRVRELADKPLNDLRSDAGYGCKTQAEAIRINRYKKRGELIEEIITEEFTREFPRDFWEE